jgi:hypothetical protein
VEVSDNTFVYHALCWRSFISLNNARNTVLRLKIEEHYGDDCSWSQFCSFGDRSWGWMDNHFLYAFVWVMCEKKTWSHGVRLSLYWHESKHTAGTNTIRTHDTTYNRYKHNPHTWHNIQQVQTQSAHMTQHFVLRSTPRIHSSLGRNILLSWYKCGLSNSTQQSLKKLTVG